MTTPQTPEKARALTTDALPHADPYGLNDPPRRPPTTLQVIADIRKSIVDGKRDDALSLLDVVEKRAHDAASGSPASLTHSLRIIGEQLPKSLADAQHVAESALMYWKETADRKNVAERALREADKLGGAVRQRCVEELIKGETRPAAGPDLEDGFAAGEQIVVRKPLAPSVAKDAASNHPTYVAHKERLFALGIARDDAANDERQAAETLLNAREHLRAEIARSMLRSSGFAE